MGYYLLLLFIIVGIIISVIVFRLHKELKQIKEDFKCPECGHMLKFNVRDELTEDYLHIVDYWCPHCGFKITLPKNNKE